MSDIIYLPATERPIGEQYPFVENTKHEIPEPPAIEKSRYSQQWSAYNAAQTNEKAFMMRILDELLNFLPKEETKIGRPKVPLRDRIFAICLHQYIGLSSRRTTCDIDDAEAKEYLFKRFHFNTLLRFYKEPSLIKHLKNLLELSGKPLSDIEEHFTIDSSGFSTQIYGRWLDHKYGKKHNSRSFKKAHIVSGAKTNIITAVNVTPSNFADCPQLPPLIQRTAKNFRMKEVSGDKAYLSRKNLEIIDSFGAFPLIPFKTNNIYNSQDKSLWGKMYNYFYSNYDEFKKRYSLRSNAESVFSMMKRKMRMTLRTKSEISQVNEILAKCLVHNLCVLIQEYYELRINIDFGATTRFDATR